MRWTGWLRLAIPSTAMLRTTVGAPEEQECEHIHRPASHADYSAAAHHQHCLIWPLTLDPRRARNGRLQSAHDAAGPARHGRGLWARPAAADSVRQVAVGRGAPQLWRHL